MDHTHYYHAPDLARFPEVGKGAPELWEKFLAWYDAVFAEGRSRRARRPSSHWP
jgi:hypothetical protein